MFIDHGNTERPQSCFFGAAAWLLDASDTRRVVDGPFVP